MRRTIGIDFKTKNVKMRDGKNIKLLILDTTGVERFREITKQYYKGAEGIILIYDVTNINSFNNLENWLKDIKLNVYHNTPIIVVGNKNDNEKYRIVTKEHGKNFSEKNEPIYFLNVQQKLEKILIIFLMNYIWSLNFTFFKLSYYFFILIYILRERR